MIEEEVLPVAAFNILQLSRVQLLYGIMNIELNANLSL